MTKAADWNDLARNGGDDAVRAAFDVGLREQPPKPNGKGECPLIQSSREFVANFVAPDYLVGRVIQRRFLYSLTAPTGAGKTAICLLIAAHIGLGREIGGLEVEQGRVLYFAGENPDDTRGRWLAMAEHMHFDLDRTPVHFIPGRFRISELKARIAIEAEAHGGYDLVVVDTSATYFEGENENDNRDLGDHARLLRELTAMPGRPCVVAACHPVKNAAADNLIPRGGGAYIAEVDGNLTCTKNDATVELNWQGKLRGPGFEPIHFELVEVQADAVRDAKGRHIPTVIARPLSEREHAERTSKFRDEQDALLLAMAANEGASVAALACAIGWVTSNGAPHKSKVARRLKQLEKEKLVTQDRGTWAATEKGKKAAERIKINTDLAGARY